MGSLPLKLVSAIAALTLIVSSAMAYPDRPVTMVVPASAGGPTDTVARLIAQSMSGTLGQQVVVENVPGAVLASGRVAHAQPDGYTLLFFNTAFATTPAFKKNLSWDPIKDFEPVSLVNDGPFVLITKKDFSAATAQELFEKIKTEGEQLTMAHGGFGGGAHLCGILISQQLNSNLTYVSYKGAAPALVDVLAGQVDMMCAQTTDVLPHLEAGTVKAFATTGAARVTQLKDVPTLEELGLKDARITQWHALFAPNDTPKDVLDTLNDAVRKALADQTIKSRLEGVGTVVFTGDQLTPQALSTKLQSEVTLWADVAKRAGITPQ